ncbi:hypothetical protein, partial [Nodularia chucula]|uniref:hypothetical protein n=1 Tax=Nodularia chucula TaxID=3093667 RepID=UPI0039C5AF25
REVDRLTGRLDAVTGAQAGVAKGAQVMGAAVTSAIGGMASADWDKYLKNLIAARDVIGLTGQQAGEYKAKAEGANQAQAALAGAIAG